MSMILKQEITEPVAWRGCDLQNNESWITPLSEETLDVFQRAASQVTSRGLRFSDMRANDFHIPELDEDIKR